MPAPSTQLTTLSQESILGDRIAMKLVLTKLARGLSLGRSRGQCCWRAPPYVINGSYPNRNFA